MDFLDDEPTPEERQALIVQALRAKMGGAMAQPQAQAQQPEEAPNEADFYRGWGNMNLRSGDRVLGGLGQAQIGQAGQMDANNSRLMLRSLLAQKPNAAITANRGMEAAVKDQFPDVWEKLNGQGLTDASWGKVYMQQNAKGRTDSSQAGADRRAKFNQGETNTRFGKTNALATTKQAADLGAREVAGASDVDPTQHKPISQEQATSLAEMKAAADTVIEKTRAAKKLYGKGGLILPGSTQDAQLRQLIVETYGPMLKTGNIGNLTDSHLHLLQDMLANPAGDWKSFINDKRFPAMLKGLEDGATSNLEHQANSVGRTFAAPKAKAATPGTDHSHDDALQWLKDNPNDPNATAVRATLKGNGFDL